MNEDILYKQYANVKYLTEQIAVVSDDMNVRLKQYLSNEKLLEKLAQVFKQLQNGEISTLKQLQISPSDFDILTDDVINVKCDLTDSKNPKYTMWVLNDEFIFGDVDMALAAKKLWQSGQEGNVVTGLLNAVGSAFGIGDAGDAGTNEKELVAIAAAICSIADEKAIDPLPYFDKLSIEFSKMGKGSLVDFLETEFGGNSECVALNTFRQPISDSMTRGVNLGQFIVDVGITIFSAGIGTALSKGGKVAKVGGKAAPVLTKTAAVTKGVTATGKIAKAAASMKTAWTALSNSVKVARLNKLAKAGTPLTYVMANGNKVTRVIKSAKGGQIVWANTTKIGPSVANVVMNGGATLAPASLALLVPSTAKKLAIGTGLGVSTHAETSKVDLADFNPLEIMGWYDHVTANPNAYLQTIEDSSAANIADMIWSLSKGSGIWGNTTDRDELKLALIITSLKPGVARDVQAEFKKLDPLRTVYKVIDEELGGIFGTEDSVYFAKAWWAACTQDGIENHDEIAAVKELIYTPGGGGPSKIKSTI
jgi:hypothetical protein